MTMCLAFYKIPSQWEPQTNEEILRLKDRHFTFKVICCIALAGLDFYLSVKMRPHHFPVSFAATVSWWVNHEQKQTLPLLTLVRILTVAALSASARDLYLTHLDEDRRQKRRIEPSPIDPSVIPVMVVVRRQDSWVQ